MTQAIRIGHGYDVHRFGDGDHITLGGVKIAHHYGFIAHSDGDVLIHAVCDALLGAVAEGDIGQHFPDSDSRYRDIDSRVLLREVYAKVTDKGFTLSNIDMTIVAQAPVLSPYIADMRDNISNDLGVAEDQVNIKATTTEKLGYTGREEGIAAHAVVVVCSL